jgi:hypothetical protein
MECVCGCMGRALVCVSLPIVAMWLYPPSFLFKLGGECAEPMGSQLFG